ncbi:molecular chaperone protein HspA/DnaK [Candidatus Magnetoovum chiemensis]|nr:molecular chaperone protein HspA/DnaK [Candidatus Magnetoovum chiemensis]
MKNSRFIIGIDLGTTNSTLSYIDSKTGAKGATGAERGKSSTHDLDDNDVRLIGNNTYRIQIFKIPQLVDDNTIKELDAFPSFLYIPQDYEQPSDAFQLPWDKHPSYICGDFARKKGSLIASNLVSSAKSWLCHNRVDRKAPILPWGKEETKGKMSPVEALSLYLQHLKNAWNHLMSLGLEENRLENQQIVLTIPSSFDESARELTKEAAKQAGFKEFTLLEEPQAAFYSWLSWHENDWNDYIQNDELVLVFDVGGGTTDFNLIALQGQENTFQRLAVGDHLMLGGDNMDLALAREIELKLSSSASKLNFNQWLTLSYQCRAAKELILNDDKIDNMPISILGTGRGVIGGALNTNISRHEINRVILEGFFKRVELSEDVSSGRVGLRELGLPYVSDPAVMKHLASFLRRHAVNRQLKSVIDKKSGASFVRPDVILFNGGVFKSEAIRKYALDVINYWFFDKTESIKVIENDKLDHAVSIGAAYYGYVLRGSGVKITGGAGKAYYIKVETERQAEDLKDPLTCVCIVSRGMEEGQSVHLSTPEFHVMANMPVSFSLFSSSYKVGDKPGDIVTVERDALNELPNIKTALHYGKKSATLKIPVSLAITLNEYGTLDVWCESKTTPHRWRLEFQVRLENDTSSAPSDYLGLSERHTIDENTVNEACRIIESAFTGLDDTVTTENVMKKLIALFDLDKTQWPLFAIRTLWDVLIKLKDKRTITSKHEARWLNIAGFLLRPGFGHPLDEWRIKEIWKIFSAGAVFTRDGQCRSEWWILWRRLAGGLSDINQDVIYKKISPYLLSDKKKSAVRSFPSEVIEMWMLAASLENLPIPVKIKLGEGLINLIKKEKGKTLGNYYWAISRIAARHPFHGKIDKVVPKDTAQKWLEEIVCLKWHKPHEGVYAVSQIARKTNDRTRDIDDNIIDKVKEKLYSQEVASSMSKDKLEHFVVQITELVELEWEDEKRIFGESLPIGLFVE